MILLHAVVHLVQASGQKSVNMKGGGELEVTPENKWITMQRMQSTSNLHSTAVISKLCVLGPSGSCNLIFGGSTTVDGKIKQLITSSYSRNRYYSC